ncbi:MAG: acyl-CoA dehydrogenase family protein [Myxococcota bacterium]|jgi:alkylation response protein AidB-like acyl-CoA dehydrogenase|nr:acyl-CoA dehydrogenase family protein [Myxococcota bacterium]
MRFAFTNEQLEIRDAVRDALETECSPEVVRSAWQSPAGHLWPLLAELGVLGVNLPESVGGLGMSAVDWVLLLEESGRVALPDPLADVVTAAPFLVESGQTELAASLAAGQARVCVLYEDDPGLDADRAALILRVQGTEVHAIREPTLTVQKSMDGARRLFSVTGRAEPLDGDGGSLVDRGVLAASAQLLGLTRHVLDAAVAYSKERTQFGKAIGSFQAVQHHLVDALLALRFAAPMVYRAAWSQHESDPEASMHTSMAKIYATEAARLACRKSLQVHGAIGYTFEYDLHMWMKRIWALAAAWGDPARHRDRVAATILGEHHA